jgi:hypothetical protein
MVAFESTIERDCIYCLEFDPLVHSYEEQPLVITYPYRERLTTYTPDFLAQYRDRQRLLECKSEAQVDHPDNQRKFVAGRQWSHEHRCEYIVVTERDLRTGHRLANIKLLTRFARHPAPRDRLTRTLAMVTSQSTGLSIADLITALGNATPDHVAQADIYHLLYRGALLTDMETPLSRLSRVNLGGKP